MALLGIDELNTPKVEVEEPEKYFSKMAISKEQKEERVDTANDIMDVLLFFFALLAIEMQENNPDYDMVLEKFRVRFGETVAAHSRMDDHQNAYVNEFTQDQFDVTRRHMEAVGVGVDGQTDAGWWSSPDRAMSIGEDAANTILNYEELKQAAEAGAVGKKWVDRDDGKVRPTHNEVPKKIIPLAEYFVVGDGIMQYPCDWDNNPNECYRCRCSCHYYDKDGKVVKIVAHYNGHIVKNNGSIQYTNGADYASIKSRKEALFNLDLQYFGDKTKHAVYRQNQRKFSDEDIRDAIENPLDDPENYFDYNENGDPYVKYIGERVIVIVNPDTGKHVTYEKPSNALIRRLKNDI